MGAGRAIGQRRLTSGAGLFTRAAGFDSIQSWSIAKFSIVRTHASVRFAITGARSAMSSMSARTSRRVRSRTDRSPQEGRTLAVRMRKSSWLRSGYRCLSPVKTTSRPTPATRPPSGQRGRSVFALPGSSG